MSKVLLDTDILSEHLKGYDKVVAGHADDYARRYGRFTFTSVTVHEIVLGLELKGASGQLRTALVWLDQNEQITPVARDFYDAALIRAKARKQGFVLQLADCLIATVAIRLDLPLVTGNMGDFQAVQNTGAKLTIENWRVK